MTSIWRCSQNIFGNGFSSLTINCIWSLAASFMMIIMHPAYCRDLSRTVNFVCWCSLQIRWRSLLWSAQKILRKIKFVEIWVSLMIRICCVWRASLSLRICTWEASALRIMQDSTAHRCSRPVWRKWVWKYTAIIWFRVIRTTFHWSSARKVTDITTILKPPNRW